MDLFPELRDGQLRDRLETACREQRSEGLRFEAAALDDMQAHLALIPTESQIMEAVLRWSPPQAKLTWQQRLLFDGDVMEWLLDHSSDMVVIVSPIFEVMYFNEPAETFLAQHFQQQIALGVDFWTYVSPSYERDFLDKVNQAFAGEVVKWQERKITLPDQKVRWVSSTFFPVRNDADRLFWVALLYHDIHEEKMVREEVTRQQEKLARISFHQSHRIRRHVANQLALIEMIQEEELSGVNRRMFEWLKAEIQRLDAVIHEVTNDIYS